MAQDWKPIVREHLIVLIRSVLYAIGYTLFCSTRYASQMAKITGMG